MKKALWGLLLSASVCVTAAYGGVKEDIDKAREEWKEEQKDTKNNPKEGFSSWLHQKYPKLYEQREAYQAENLKKYSIERALVDKADLNREFKSTEVKSNAAHRLAFKEKQSLPLIGGKTFPYTQSLAWADNVIESSLERGNNAVAHGKKSNSAFSSEVLEKFRREQTPQEKLEFLMKDNHSLLQKLLMLSPSGELDIKKEVKGYWVIKDILAEEVKHANAFVVYRSQAPQITTLFNLYSEIASLVRMNDQTTHRIALEDLEQTIQEFYNKTCALGEDESTQYGKYGITGSISLLDQSPQESALPFWQWEGKGNLHPNIPQPVLEQLIQFVLGETPDPEKSKYISDTIKEISETSNGLGKAMMQIFISPEIADRVLWIAAPYGKKVKGHDQAPTREILESVLKDPKTYTVYTEIGRGYSFQEVYSAWVNFQARIVDHLKEST